MIERMAIAEANGFRIGKDLTEKEQKEMARRRKKKVDGVRTLAENITKLRHNLARDLKSDDKREVMTAVAITIMDKTAERVGNDDSAADGHFGVTGFRKKHITIDGDRINLKYTGKSGVEHDKSFTDAGIAGILKKNLEKCEPNDPILACGDEYSVKADRINRYLEDFGVTAKDMRGYAANNLMSDALKGVKVPSDEKERKKKWLEVLGNVAEQVGHGKEMLRKQYLLPNFEDTWIKKGKIVNLKTANKESKITWKKPDLREEVDEYFENDVTKRFFSKHGLEFGDDEELLDFLRNGKLVNITRKDLKDSENITTDPLEFADELKDSEYRTSYSEMQGALSKGSITLPAPILIKFGDTYYGFAGNRRMNLSWANGEGVKFWVINAVH